ncbi:hypothetical protein BGZ65_004758 [Modicella reniformis]|uniref:BHLH domain-containing protein n=1 Tax=Modicella reniformis TaxID=1440133 RepID=A0A9P6LRQ3_9FUNG|nr:hypothetical protein BGZ65_004758 [Modicella reniformis]
MALPASSFASTTSVFQVVPPPPSMTSARQSAAQSKATSGGSSTKRRTSTNAKAVDQETREMMRKVSHSAIERRRRERINDKILQLKHLVPACVDEDHLHKLSILQSTIEYVQYLKSVVPESVANTKFPRASNSNPNNKTTDMLDAHNTTTTTTTTTAGDFVPMMTTGLGHPYSKRAQVDQAIGSWEDSTDPSHEPRRASTAQSSSDEDAKDGLLLLSQMSSVTMSVNTSPGALEGSGDSAKDRRNRRMLMESGEDNDEERALMDDSEVDDDLDEDDDYRDDEIMEESDTDKEDTTRRRNSSKMSVEQMLC